MESVTTGERCPGEFNVLREECLRSRRAQISLDLAWAQRKRDAEATLHLLEAER